MIKVDLSGAAEFFDAAGPDYAAAAKAHRALTEGTGAGAAFTGWLHNAARFSNGEMKAVLTAARRTRSRSQALVVIGIGGSYLGAKGAIELLRPIQSPDAPEILFAGTNLSPDALSDLVTRLGNRDFEINVISKSGGTLEPALAFRFFRELLRKKYGPAAAKRRITATTDAAKGRLRAMAEAEGWECFTIPDDIGGRYSVLSAVGLFPMAVAGIDIEQVISAASAAMADFDLRSPENPVWKYAAARQNLYHLGRNIEILACYEPSFRYMAEWWKQLYGESEGKNGIGIFPASVEYTADLHSMGQYIQDGPRHMMETVVRFTESLTDCKVPFEMGDPDGLNYLVGRQLHDISNTAAEAVRAAHIAGGVPNLVIEVQRRDETGFAELVCFFELACAISGYMSGINPFDQPGVEAYKKNMFRMLGRPEE